MTYCPELACTRLDGHDGDHGNGSHGWPRVPLSPAPERTWTDEEVFAACTWAIKSMRMGLDDSQIWARAMQAMQEARVALDEMGATAVTLKAQS